MTSARWPDAALLGISASMRTMTPGAVLAARGRLRGRARGAAIAAAAGEMAFDKAPFAMPRIVGPALIGRASSGALAGSAVAGPAGAVAGGATAALGTFATYGLRARLGNVVADPIVAVAEDVAAVSAAVVATREHDAEGDPEPEPPLRAAARGLAAGVAGTAAMTIAQTAYYQLTGAKPSDAPLQVAEKAVDVPRRHRAAVNNAMHWLYGSSWGIPFGLAAGTTGAKPEPSGVALGLTVWGVGLAQLPALGLAPPPWKQSPVALATDAAFHLVYGLGAAAAFRALGPRSRTR